MNPQVQNYYSHYTQHSEVYRKLLSLAIDIRNSYQHDCDETDSIKEIIEIIKSILIMASLEEYFSNNQTDLNYFMGEFSKEVIEYTLRQDKVYGDNGHELALDLLFHFIKLFFKFHKIKEYSNLFENIRKIFDLSSSYFSPNRFHSDKNPKKARTYQQFNEEFCSQFKKEEKNEELFKVGDKVDFLCTKDTHFQVEKKIWIRGEIKQIEDDNYIINYPYRDYCKEIKIPTKSKKVKPYKTMTSDWEWRLNLKRFDLVDCYDRGKWYPATVFKIEEFKNKLGDYKEYKIGYRLYPDKIMENKDYDYSDFVSNYIFWDNSNNSTDSEGNSYYGDSEHADDTLSFYSKRIQKFKKYSTIQKEVLSNQLNQYNNQYANIINNRNGQSTILSQGDQSEERIKYMTELLSYEKDDNNEDELYYYEKDGKKNYILGKNNDEFKYYYARLLKLMEEEKLFEELISFLKDKPNMIELYNIFFILQKCDAFLHKDFFQENKEAFKMAFLDTVESLTSKDLKNTQKEFFDYSINFLSRVDYLITGLKNPTKSDVKFELAIKLIKSSIFDKKIQGLKMLTEYIKMNLELEEKKYIIETIKKNNIIKELFGSNYHTQIINKSNEIIEFMLKNNELTEEEIKLIWSLTEQGDLEAKMTIIKLISNFIIHLNENLCNVILNSINIEKITNFSEKEIDLIKNLAIKANNKKFICKCCEIFSDKILEINNLNLLEKSPYVNILVNFFEKDEICCKRIVEICEGNLKENKNVLNILFLLEKIIEKNKNNINKEKNNEINEEKDFISKEINKLIDDNKLLILFEDNFKSYKQRAKEAIKNSQSLLIDGYNHDSNMRYRIVFLIKIIPIIYPKFDFFSLLKEICLVEPILESDKFFFYDFMEKFISEGNKDSSDNSNEEKIAIKEQLFNMLANENKSNISLSQFNLYIQLFFDINSHKNFVSYFKPSESYLVTVNYHIDLKDIFGIDKLWDLLFELKSESLSKKLINIIYSLYKSKNEIQVLIDKCVNLIKETDDNNYNKLKVCMNILIYIIDDSEKSGIIQIRSHNKLLKECLICLNLDLKKNTNAAAFYLNKFKSSTKNKCVLYGNTTLNEIKQILAEKYKIEEKDINVNLKLGTDQTFLDNSYSNKTLIEIFNLNRQVKRGLESAKLKFIGNYEESQYLVKYGHVNQKFESMLKEWFNILTNGNEIMEKDAIDNYISKIDPNSPIDENNSLYIKLMQYDKGNKYCLLEEEFCEFYTDLAKSDEDTVWEHIKKMGYGKSLERVFEFKDDNYKILDKNNLPRYILGNDINFHEALLRAFNKFDKKMEIYDFLFFLSTNEKKYNDLLNNENKENKDDINYLEELYNLLIIQSFLQDLESTKLNLEILFSERSKKEMDIFGQTKETSNKGLKIVAKKYLPFDEEDNLEKKRLFFIDYIEKGGYEKLINSIAQTLACIKNNHLDEEKIKFCQQAIELISILYDSLINKDKQKEKKSDDEVYYLFEQINIVQILSAKEEKKEDSENKINKLKEIVINTNYITLIETIILFILKFNDSLNKQCLKLFLKLITTNQKLFEQFKSNEKIKQNLSDLIKNNIINNDKFFIQILLDYIKDISSNKKDTNKLNNEFLIYLFSISNSLFNELIIKKTEVNNDEKKSKSILFFFEYFSDLLKELLKNNDDNNLTSILNEDFINQIFNLLYNDIKEKNMNKKKLSEEIFIGIIKILITLIRGNHEIKEQILSKTINNETLFDIIYNKIMPDNNENNNNKNKNEEDDLDINNLLNQMNNENENKENDEINYNKFIKIESLSEIIHIFNTTKKEDTEEIISEKVSINFKNFIMACLTDCTHVDLILKLLHILSSFNSLKNSRINSSNNKNKSKSKKEPKKCGYVGLKNLGCICYMNSILQQMYMVPPFRYAIISSDDKKEIKTVKSSFNQNFYDDNLLHQLQKMYTFLTFSEKQAYNPKDFCSSFKDLDGQPINILLQQDSQEFFNNFCDKIESFLNKTKYEYIIDNIFTGKMCSSVICEKCNTVSNKFEDFYNLSLEVKNINNLYDSLKKFTEPEKIEEFNCETCKKKVTISKRTSLAKLPNVLFVHLKRFYMNYETEGTEKINSKFEFPNTINLSKFCVEEITKIKNKEQESDEIYPKLEEYYEYELKGINVHLGSAEGGHYISFIDVERDGENNTPKIQSSIENGVIKSRWLKFNDSIVTEFDTKDIPIESYGGFVNDNINNENCQNAYLLIYERKKKTPIKIVIEKENEEKYLKNEKYKIISFPKEKRNYINKLYDIYYSNIDPNSKIKENDLYNIIFKDEEKDECYFYTPYYNIERNVLKENFIEVMNKNKKFLNRSVNIPIDLSKYKEKWYEILFSIINTKEFDILNELYSYTEKRQFINYFKNEVFDNKIYKVTLQLSDEQKIIINDKANILLKKVILPLVNAKNKNDVINELLSTICTILTTDGNMSKIFECKNTMITGVFNIENVKLFCDVIYSIISCGETVNYNKKNFKDLFEILKNVKLNKDDSPFLVNNMNSNDDNEEEEKDNYKEVIGYYYLDLIYKIFKLNNDNIICVNDSDPISTFISKLKKKHPKQIRNLIYEIVQYLLDKYYWKKLKKGNNYEKTRIQNLITNNDTLRILFEEKSDLLGILLDICEYDDERFSRIFNDQGISSVFDYALKKKKLKEMLTVFFAIINIKDNLTINRLYQIMGFPYMIIKNKKEKIKEEIKKDEEKNINKIEDLEINIEEEKEKEKEKDIITIFPKFGCKLLEENKENEIYFYRGFYKTNEIHCLLALLFPSSDIDIYLNKEEIKNMEKLTKKQINNYIYKLLSMSLLNEGNYALFKYLYLTQSRFIKYKNIYEEMIDILSQEKEEKFDLSEIIKNAEICSKRVNYEVNIIESNINKILKQDLDYDLNEYQNEEKPPLPENMEKNYKEYDDIEEFTGFIPRQLPDKIIKVEYVFQTRQNHLSLFFVNYYTTFQDMNTILEKKEINIEQEKEEGKKEEEKKEEEKKEDEKKEDKNEIVDNKEKKDEEDDDDEDIISKIRNKNKIYYRNKIEDNEEKIFTKLIKLKNDSNIEKITIINDSKKTNVNGKLLLKRAVLFSNKIERITWNANFGEAYHHNYKRYNYYYPDYSKGLLRKTDDLLVIYRRFVNLDFISENGFKININTSSSLIPNESNGMDDSF